MTSGRPEESHKSLNPYAASAVPESQETPASPSSATPLRKYRLEMQWADRRRFLKTVGLLRFVAIAGALLGLYAIYGLLMSFYSAVQMGDLAIWLQPAMVARWLLTLAKYGIALYSVWLQWKLADIIAATAGGTTGSMTAWSQIQRHIALIAIVTLAAGVLTPAWEWLTLHLFAGIGR